MSLRSSELPIPTESAVRLLITGSREWPDTGDVQSALNFYWDLSGHITVVHGDAPKGADRMARNWCEKMNDGAVEAIGGIAVDEERYPARWDIYGPWAGPGRNKDMVDDGAFACLAFIAPCTMAKCRDKDPHGSHGATHCVNLAERAGIVTIRWTLK